MRSRIKSLKTGIDWRGCLLGLMSKQNIACEYGATEESMKDVPYPDIETKQKAQPFIGLDVEQLNAEKQEFLKTIVPEWDELAAEREKDYVVKNS